MENRDKLQQRNQSEKIGLPSLQTELVDKLLPFQPTHAWPRPGLQLGLKLQMPLPPALPSRGRGRHRPATPSHSAKRPPSLRMVMLSGKQSSDVLEMLNTTN